MCPKGRGQLNIPGPVLWIKSITNEIMRRENHVLTFSISDGLTSSLLVGKKILTSWSNPEVASIGKCGWGSRTLTCVIIFKRKSCKGCVCKYAPSPHCHHGEYARRVAEDTRKKMLDRQMGQLSLHISLEQNLTIRSHAVEKRGISVIVVTQASICHWLEVPNRQGNYPFTY